MDKVLKDNKELVMRCKELEIRMETKEKANCVLEEKSIKEEHQIADMSYVIEKLNMEIKSLENVVEAVKETQARVREEYETTLIKQRKFFDDSITEMTRTHVQKVESVDKRTREEKVKLETQVQQLKDKLDSPVTFLSPLICPPTSNCWTSCSSQSSVSQSPTPSPSLRSCSEATHVSGSSMDSVRTVMEAINRVVGEENGIKDDEDFDIGDDLEKSWEMFSGMLKAKDMEMEKLKMDVKDLLLEKDLHEVKGNQNIELRRIVEEQAETIQQLEVENVELTELLRRKEKKLTKEKKRDNNMEIEVERITEELRETENQLKDTQVLLSEAKDDIASLEEANGKLKEQAISQLVDAAEADHDSLLKEQAKIEKEDKDENDGRRDAEDVEISEFDSSQITMKTDGLRQKKIQNSNSTYIISFVILTLAILYFYIMV